MNNLHQSFANFDENIVVELQAINQVFSHVTCVKTMTS